MTNGERDITFDRAVELVRAWAVPVGVEDVPVGRAVGRVPVTPVTMAGDHPAFDNSAMDGWAVRSADTPGLLSPVGESAAGSPWDGTVGAGQAVGISTGARLPAGADAVVQRERVEVRAGVVAVPETPPGAFVRRRGEDAREGDVLLPAGVRIAPHQVAAVAAAGWGTVHCRASVRVALVVSGDEIVPAGSPLGPGQVWDINGVALPALIADAGGVMVAQGVVRDDPDETRAALAAALDNADLVVTSGGVSVGDHDHIRPALADLGVEEVFWGVEIRPGHPLYLGHRGDTRVLCLPGNPVSAVVCFLVFGRPLLACPDVWEAVPMAAAYRPGTRRTDLIRCVREPEGLLPAARQASHNVTSLAAATHIAAVPAGTDEVGVGDTVMAVAIPG